VEALTPVKAPRFLLTYAQKDVSTTISQFLLSLTYTDKLKGEADELEITLSDKAGRWRNAWYPQKGDVLALQIGYATEARLPAGEFQIDEVEFSGPPDTVTIRGLAAGINEDVRTKRSLAYEKQALRQVVQAAAIRHGFKVVGTIGDLRFERITQNGETDLAFLKRLAEAYGYAFSVKGKTLVFHDLAELDAQAAVLVIKRQHLNSYSLKDKATGVYRGVTVKYHDPMTGKEISHTENAPGVTTGDILKLTDRCENKAQAIALAKAALRTSHGRETGGTISLDGDRRMVAGNNVELTEMDRFNGVYQIRQARHILDRNGGWSVDNEVQRVAGKVG
jgi:phage protein D